MKFNDGVNDLMQFNDEFDDLMVNLITFNYI